MSASFRPCALIPTHDNPRTVRSVVSRVRRHLPDVVLVDDGSGAEGRRAVDAIAREGLAHVVRRPQRGGKGAAVKTGFGEALRLGFSHAVQVDADGQHDPEDVPRFLDLARRHPDALVLGRPVFDASQPRGRAFARRISTFWVRVETGGRLALDPQCGFRVYPIAASLAAGARGDHMEFDQEIAVRLVWHRTRVLNVPTRVRYLSPDEGGVSHFELLHDNVRISWLHTRLACAAAGRALAGLAGRGPRHGNGRPRGPMR